MEREPELVAVPIGVDLSARVLAADERVVLRYTAVVREPQHFAEVIAETLRAHPNAVVVFRLAAQRVAIADGEIQRLVRAE